MKLSEFLEEYGGAPIELEDLASHASEVTNAPKLRQAAENFLQAMAAFENALDAVDYEHG